MTEHDLDILADAQYYVSRLWHYLPRLRQMDVVMLCKLRHRLENEDSFVPDNVVMKWLELLIEENHADEKRIKNRVIHNPDFDDLSGGFNSPDTELTHD